ncbi:MAG: NERD domain-containing protein [Ruminococcaceae bacterium]|nr:NERD domain-containing protein [Oscillospiraceae bacterium]
MTLNNLFIILFAGILLVLAFAGFALYTGDSNFFKNRQKQDSAKTAFSRTMHRIAVLKNYEVMENVTFEFNGEKFSFDVVLLSGYGTVGIKACYAKGDIYGGVNDVNWLCVPNTTLSHKEYFENPVRQLGGSVRFFKDIYKAEKVKGGSADSFVVFPFSKTTLYLGKNAPAYTLGDAQDVLSGQKYAADNSADVAAMKTALEKYIVK